MQKNHTQAQTGPSSNGLDQFGLRFWIPEQVQAEKLAKLAEANHLFQNNK